MKLDIQKNEEEKMILVIFKGRLDSLSVPEIEDDLLSQLEDSQFKTIRLDCKELDYIASSGLRLFVNILKVGRGYGARLIVKDANEFLRKIFDATGLRTMFIFE